MSDTKFTPGPWKFTDPDDANGVDVMLIQSVQGGQVVAHVLGVIDFPCLDEGQHDIGTIAKEMKSNAQLIIAAPDLYDAIAFDLDPNSEPTNHPLYAEWRETHIVGGVTKQGFSFWLKQRAIAKARGEQ